MESHIMIGYMIHAGLPPCPIECATHVVAFYARHWQWPAARTAVELVQVVLRDEVGVDNNPCHPWQ
jgi:hypothetical protein